MNEETIISIVAALWVALSAIVGATNTQRDDKALSWVRRLIERLSLTQPRNAPGTFSLPGAKANRPVDDGSEKS